MRQQTLPMSDFHVKIRRGCPGSPRRPRSEGDGPVPVAFLDRDGVINDDRGYVHKVEDFEWMPGALAAIRHLKQKGYLVAIVTNQSGIGRGFYNEEDFMFLTLWMLDYADKVGAEIDVVYYCPHHPESTDPEYMAVCPARKPGAGMLEVAAEEFDIDVTQSFLVGNRESDLGAAKAFGIPGHLYEGSNLEQFVCEILG